MFFCPAHRLGADHQGKWSSFLGQGAQGVVGEEKMMNESIIPGIVIGVIVAVASGYMSHVLRKREMQDVWAEEKRRRKSDQKREIRKGMLGTVRDAADMVLDARTKLGSLGPLYGVGDRESRMKLAGELLLVLERGRSVASSLEDAKLKESFFRLYEVR